MEVRRWIDDNMRTRTALVLFFTSIALSVMVFFTLASWAGTKVIEGSKGKAGSKANVEWREFAKALAEAEGSERPVLVDVYTSWCGWCKRMDKYTYSDEEVIDKIESTFVPVKFNAESKEKTTYRGDEYTYQQIAKGFRITGYPTTLFLDSEGGHITTVPGFMKPEQFLTVLHFIGDGHYKEKSFEEFSKEFELARK